MATKRKPSAGLSRGTRAEDWEKNIKGSDKSPAEQKKIAKKFPKKADVERVNKYKSAAKAVEQRAAHARGESPLAKRRAANAAKTASKVVKASRFARGGLISAALGAATYLGSKIKGAYDANKVTQSALERDAANKKTSAPAKAPTEKPKAATKSAPTKKYGTTLAGIKKTKGGDYAIYKKGSADASAFRSAYKSARAGSTFEWRGRKYKKP